MRMSTSKMIAATNRDLAAMAQENKFRSGSYYRLKVFPIRVPSLRERAQDIPLIVRTLEQSNWVISGGSGAAARLGMKRSTLQLRMQKLGIQITRTGANGAP